MGRREFLKATLRAAFSFVAAAISAAVLYLYPGRTKERSLIYVLLTDEEEIPKKGVKRISYQYQIEDRSISSRVYLVSGDESLMALSPVCTHLGCFVSWNQNRQEFICPCHGGKYNIHGDVIAGPPSRSLARMPLKLEDGKLFLGVRI